MYGANVIIFEGIMAFYNTEVLEVSNILLKLKLHLLIIYFILIFLFKIT